VVINGIDRIKISVQGEDTAAMSGSTLVWSAKGTVALGAAPACAFKLANFTAKTEGDAIRVVYAGTACGVPGPLF